MLTGFKYIGEKIHDWETLSEGPKFLFGAEESYGYLVGTQSRDKDAVASSCLIAEIALFAKEKNKTLLDLLHDIYAQCGIFKEAQYSIDFPAGKEGMEKQKQLMIHLRNYPLQNLLNAKLKTSEDYLTKKRKNHFTQLEESINLPTSDVLSYRFDDDSKVVIRPSGTEPKLKMYVGISLEVDAFSDLNAQITIAEKKLHGIMEILKKYLEKTSE